MKKIIRSGKRFTMALLVFAVCLYAFPKMPLNAQISLMNGREISVRNVNAVIVDNENTKWFSTDAGILSFDGLDWKLYDNNENLPKKDLRSLTIVSSAEGAELWIASPDGASVTRLPVDDRAEVLTYNPENATMMSQNVLALAAGLDNISWIGTEKGISAQLDETWLTPDYDGFYTERMFANYPITSMATNPRGDTLYVGTSGIGVARLYRDQLDGISGASVYAQWGPIDLPSDNVRSVYIAPDGTKWFGTEAGIARHTGEETLDNWTVFTTQDGLIHDYVQAICGDKQGNIWFGTKEGLSVFDGSTWTSHTTGNGLVSNNILALATDRNGVVWIGTEAGISSFKDGEFISY